MLRTVTLPCLPGAPWDDFAWPSKAGADSLDYLLDCQDWQAEAGLVLQSVFVDVTPGLSLLGISYPQNGAGTIVGAICRLSGGNAGLISTVRLNCTFIKALVDQNDDTLTSDDGSPLQMDDSLPSGVDLQVIVSLPVRAEYPIYYAEIGTGELNSLTLMPLL